MSKIQLTNNMEVLVDKEDFIHLSQYIWGAVTTNNKYIYAARGTRKNGKYSKILMHRVLLEAPKNVMVDHINGNTLDNRKSNLRLVTRNKNLQNSKLRADSNCNYKGVSKRISKLGTIRYNARIQINKKTRLYLGWFKTEQEAALAYNEAAAKHFGKFAKLNVIK